jgi:hypothetical protein
MDFYNGGGKFYSAVRTDSLYNADYVSSLKVNVTVPFSVTESENFLRIFPTKIVPTIQFPLSQLHVPPIVAPHIPLL